MKNSKNVLPIICGNIYEHYNKALFGLLAPFFATFFFSDKTSSINSLLITYAIFSLGIIFKPLGALFFGHLADIKGKKTALCLSLIGSSILCLLFSFLPSYAKIGLLAPILLSLFKAMQSFFAAGETPVGAIAALEGAKRKSLTSSIYDASSSFGAFLASLGLYALTSLNLTKSHWNLLFFIGSGASFFGFFIRKNMPNTTPPPKTSFINSLKNNYSSLITIALAYGLSHALYYFSLSFFNSFLPLISQTTQSQSIKINTQLLLLDVFLLPLFGYLAQKFSKEKIMYLTSISICLLSCPLFLLLKIPSPAIAFTVRSIFLLFGICFSAPLHHFSQEMIPTQNQAKLIALSYTIGSQCIGLPACFISLWLYKNNLSPGLYISLISFLFVFKKRLAIKTTI